MLALVGVDVVWSIASCTTILADERCPCLPACPVVIFSFGGRPGGFGEGHFACAAFQRRFAILTDQVGRLFSVEIADAQFVEL